MRKNLRTKNIDSLEQYLFNNERMYTQVLDYWNELKSKDYSITKRTSLLAIRLEGLLKDKYIFTQVQLIYAVICLTVETSLHSDF